MRLFEVASPQDVNGIMNVVKGLADRLGQNAKIPFAAFKRYINGDEIGVGTPEALVALKNSIDNTGDTLFDVDATTGVVTLNTKKKDAAQQAAANKPTGPTVDQMASNNTDLTPNL
jgi:hypothetical protein